MFDHLASSGNSWHINTLHHASMIMVSQIPQQTWITKKSCAMARMRLWSSHTMQVHLKSILRIVELWSWRAGWRGQGWRLGGGRGMVEETMLMDFVPVLWSLTTPDGESRCHRSPWNVISGLMLEWLLLCMWCIGMSLYNQLLVLYWQRAGC